MWTRRAQAGRRAIREFIATDNPAAALALDDFSRKSLPAWWIILRLAAQDVSIGREN